MFNTIDDLEKVIKVLRDQGVDKFKFNGLELEMGSLPYRESINSEQVGIEIPGQSQLDQMVGMPSSGLDDPFLDYSVVEPENHED